MSRKTKKSQGLVDAFDELDNAVTIDGYEGYYIYPNGDVYSARGRFPNGGLKRLRQTLQNGYPSVSLYKTGNVGSKGGDTVYVHRLLAKAFIPTIEEKTFVNHKDGNKTNNDLSNLEWVNQQENNLHAFQTGLMKQLKYTKEQHVEVLERYHVKGETQSFISKEMNVSETFVGDLISRGTGVRSHGLGDDIEKLLNKPLIKPITDKVKKLIWKNSEDCGCKERKELLNKLVPYKKANCLNEQEYNYLTEYFKETKSTLDLKQQRELSEIYKSVFNISIQSTNCSSCWRDYIADLKKVYNEYID